MALNLPFGINPLNPQSSVDERYGEYATLQEALTATAGTRKTGLTVMIDGSEYWFRDGIADGDLIVKTPEFSDSFIIGDDDIIYGNVSSYRQRINFTPGSQVFTLDFEPTFILGVYVNGTFLNEQEYIFTTPNQLEILNALVDGDILVFVYEKFAEDPI